MENKALIDIDTKYQVTSIRLLSFKDQDFDMLEVK